MAKEWMESLPDSLNSSETLNKYDSVEAAMQGLVDAQLHIGSSIRIPSENASAEDLTAFTDKLIAAVPNVMLKPDFDKPDQSADFFRTLGVPAEADKYTNPENITVPPEAEAGLRKAALDMNMTNAQYKKAISNMSESIAANLEVANDTRLSATTALKGEWGAAYNERVILAKKLHDENFAATGVAFEDLDPNAIRGLYTTAKALTGPGDHHFGDQPSGEIPALSPDEAQMQISEIFNNKEHPWHKPESIGHKAAMTKMLTLQAAAAGRTDEEFMQPITTLRL